MPLRREGGLLLHALDVGDRQQLRHKLGVEPINIYDEIRLRGLTTNAKGKGGKELTLSESDRRQPEDANEDAQYHQEGAALASRDIGH